MTKPVVEGMEELNRNMAKLSKNYGKAVAEAGVSGAELVRGAAIKSIQNTSDGGQVTRSRPGGGTYTHTVSAPDQAPNTDTGRLVSSIQVDVNPFGIFVGSTLEYAGYLEFGTSIMEERPWLNPALESQRRNIERLMIDAANPEGKV